MFLEPTERCKASKQGMPWYAAMKPPPSPKIPPPEGPLLHARQALARRHRAKLVHPTMAWAGLTRQARRTGGGGAGLGDLAGSAGPRRAASGLLDLLRQLRLQLLQSVTGPPLIKAVENATLAAHPVRHLAWERTRGLHTCRAGAGSPCPAPLAFTVLPARVHESLSCQCIRRGVRDTDLLF